MRICPHCSGSYNRSEKVLNEFQEPSYHCPHCGGRVRNAKTKPTLSIKKAKRLKIYERDGWVCHICGHAVDPRLMGKNSNAAPSLDHIVPRCEGGGHTYENFRLAHRWCNSARGEAPLDKLVVRTLEFAS